jgi:hypothetical protein
MSLIKISNILLAITLLLSGCKSSGQFNASSANSLTQVNALPEFPGGDEALEKYFEKSLTYVKIPELRYMKVNAIIDASGKVKSAALAEVYKLSYENKGVNPAEIDAAIIKEVFQMPDWKPSYQNGQPVEKPVEIPVLLIPEDIKEMVRNQRKMNYEFVEQMPFFPGGNSAFLNYLRNNIRYPKETDKTPGKVVVKFIVYRFGSVQEPSIIKGLNPIIDKEILRLVKDSPRWQPGRQNGIPVNTYYTVPFLIETTK